MAYTCKSLCANNQTRQLTVLVWCDLHCNREHETFWKCPKVVRVLTPDPAWESKDFLEEVIFQLRLEAWLELAEQRAFRPRKREWNMVVTRMKRN